MIFLKLLPAEDGSALLLSSTGIYTRTDGGDLKCLWSLPEPAKGSLLPVGLVHQNYAVLADTLKQVYLVCLASGKVIQSYRSEKCPTCITLKDASASALAVLVADRFGDVCLVTFENLLDSDSSKPEVELIAGHVSIITDMAVAGDALLTADRDEKIRITSMAHPYPIRAFLLGHTEYVVGLVVLTDGIVTVAGDRTVRLWNLGSEGSNSGDTLLDTLMLDADQLGRPVKVEKVLSKNEDDDEQVEEEIEEVEMHVVEPNSIVLGADGLICISFDRSPKVCRVKAEAGKLLVVDIISAPEGHQIISILPINDHLSILTYKDAAFYLISSAAVDSPTDLGEDESAGKTIEALWKSTMKKDCHGLFVKRMKSKRSRTDLDEADDDNDADELSDIDDE